MLFFRAMPLDNLSHLVWIIWSDVHIIRIPKTAREYYQILQDTLLGHELPPWRKSRKRRLIETAKFYLFDPGVVRALSGFNIIQKGTEEFGRYFEHFLIEEIRAYLSYREKNASLSYWRTSTGLEVDLIVGKMDLAIEFKAVPQVDSRQLKGLQALMEDQKVDRKLVVSLDEKLRETVAIYFFNI